MTPSGSAPVGGPGAWSRRRTWAATACLRPAGVWAANSRHTVEPDTEAGGQPRCLRPRAPKSCARSSTLRRRFSPQANAATSSPGGPCLRPRACRGSTSSQLHSSGAWRNALRRCPETRLRGHCSRLSLFCRASHWEGGGSPAPSLRSSARRALLEAAPETNGAGRATGRLPQGPRQAARSEPGTATARRERDRTSAAQVPGLTHLPHSAPPHNESGLASGATRRRPVH